MSNKLREAAEKMLAAFDENGDALWLNCWAVRPAYDGLKTALADSTPKGTKRSPEETCRERYHSPLLLEWASPSTNPGEPTDPDAAPPKVATTTDGYCTCRECGRDQCQIHAPPSDTAPEGPWKAMECAAGWWVMTVEPYRHFGGEGTSWMTETEAITVRNALNRPHEREYAENVEHGGAAVRAALIDHDMARLKGGRCEKCGAKREESALYIRETKTGEGAYMLKPCQKCKGDKTDG